MDVVRVLVVDDQQPFRRVAARVIDATEGFALVGVSHSGEDAIAAARELTPDLVLMDVNLPGIDGLAATRIIRQLPRPPEVVLVSTYDEEEFAARAVTSGAIAYVGKSSFGPERLAAVWALSSGGATASG